MWRTCYRTGEVSVCFSNEFSTFSHKLVYMDFQVGDEEPLPGIGEHLTAMTQVSIISKFKIRAQVCYVFEKFDSSKIGISPLDLSLF